MASYQSLTGAVRELATLLVSAADANERAQIAVGVAMRAVDADGATLYVHDPRSRQLRFYHAIGRRGEKEPAKIAFGLVNAEFPDNEGIVGRVLQTRQPLITNDAEFHPLHSRQVDEDFGFTTRNLATVPLRGPNGDPIAILQVLNKRGGDFVEQDLATVEVLADMLTMALAMRGEDLTS